MKYASYLLVAVILAGLMGMSIASVIGSNDGSGGKSLAAWFLFEMRRSEALQQRAIEIQQAMKIKKAVVDDLVAERVTIREATEAFHQADELIDRSTDGLIAPYRTAETQDELCHQVISWAKAELHDNPQRAEKVAQQLQNEWNEQSCQADSIQ